MIVVILKYIISLFENLQRIPEDVLNAVFAAFFVLFDPAPWKIGL